IDGAPCRVSSNAKSKPGKHGAAKSVMVAIGIFDGRKRNHMCNTSDDMPVPVLEKINAQILADMGENFQIMIMSGDYETIEIKKPPAGSLEGTLEPGKDIEILRYDNYVKISRVKE
ncbi:MAG: translation initiation factor IF-5A, partial [Candidatus Diapherotrites archaeon]|nr:translation initiation factor IF-5A [Candidatus Diapherotrites archaeon]